MRADAATVSGVIEHFWRRLGNTSRNALIPGFEPLLPQIVQPIQQGDLLIEVR
jgi:hypothetical protein